MDLKGWENCSVQYAKKNNVEFLKKQVTLIEEVAKHYGVSIITAEISDDCKVDLDFDIAYMQAHHFEFIQIVEYVMGAQNDDELNTAKEKIKEFFKRNATYKIQ